MHTQNEPGDVKLPVSSPSTSMTYVRPAINSTANQSKSLPNSMFPVALPPTATAAPVLVSVSAE